MHPVLVVQRRGKQAIFRRLKHLCAVAESHRHRERTQVNYPHGSARKGPRIVVEREDTKRIYTGLTWHRNEGQHPTGDLGAHAHRADSAPLRFARAGGRRRAVGQVELEHAFLRFDAQWRTGLVGLELKRQVVTPLPDEHAFNRMLITERA